MAWQTHRDPAHIEHVRHPLPPHLGHLDGTRIVQISDLHVGPYFRSETWASHIERISALAPDLVVITGDAMDFSRKYEADYIDPLAGLEARHGVLAILGNHDFYFGARRLTRNYREKSHVLPLRSARFETDALAGLTLWGIDDPMSSLSRRARYPILSRFDSQMDPSRYHVLLSHRPDAFESGAAHGFDLQLSGHTHGGQINYASIFGPLHFSRIMGPFDRGEFTLPSSRGTTRMYVNRGLGYTAIPYRRNCYTEITVHELHLERPMAVAE
jgi:predicted MPP superfamily phosphohydrolase